MMKAVAIYSSAGKPGDEYLRSYVERHGWHILFALRDEGITSPRPGPVFTHLCKLIGQGAVQVVVAPSVLSLGSSVDDVLTLVQALTSSNATLHLVDDGIDTSTPSGAAWLATVASLAHYRTYRRRAATKAGQARAKLAGVKFGRPRIPEATIHRVREALHRGEGVRHTARAFGLSPARVALEKKAMAHAAAVPQC
jgi:DNA invertase Pin-like site-specific DNA recombinase